MAAKDVFPSISRKTLVMKPYIPNADIAHIRTSNYSQCIACGSNGSILHANLRDRLFGAPGRWTVVRCNEPTCRLIWLDPMPIASDLPLAYTTYYTHLPMENKVAGSGIELGFRELENAYIAKKFGYSYKNLESQLRIFSLLYFYFWSRRLNLNLAVRYLRYVPDGRLLDVGCGSGKWLLGMKRRGWNTFGIDFDYKAVECAKSLGLDVECSALEEKAYPESSFDAVTLSHVIEHLPNPGKTIKECFRILKPGGSLVIITPNSISLGHSIFSSNWRGLEPPRHLHIFSPNSLTGMIKIMEPACKICVYPHIVRSIIYESFLALFSRGDRVKDNAVTRCLAKLGAVLFNALEIPFVALRHSSADCMSIVAVKGGGVPSIP